MASDVSGLIDDHVHAAPQFYGRPGAIPIPAVFYASPLTGLLPGLLPPRKEKTHWRADFNEFLIDLSFRSLKLRGRNVTKASIPIHAVALSPKATANHAKLKKRLLFCTLDVLPFPNS